MFFSKIKSTQNTEHRAQNTEWTKSNAPSHDWTYCMFVLYACTFLESDYSIQRSFLKCWKWKNEDEVKKLKWKNENHFYGIHFINSTVSYFKWIFLWLEMSRIEWTRYDEFLHLISNGYCKSTNSDNLRQEDRNQFKSFSSGVLLLSIISSISNNISSLCLDQYSS